MLYRTHAKINLYLDVLNQRDDGFHNIETIFQTVSLFDTLKCEPADAEISLAVQGAMLPGNDGNLVVRAAHLLREFYSVEKGAKLQLEKSIPIAAGLAGGSGNAAAALIALNELWELNLTINQLQEIGVILGSDIPYCLQGGTRAGTSRGEVLTQLPELPKTWFLLAHPDVEVSTPFIYHSPELKKSGRAISASGFSTEFEKTLAHLEKAGPKSVLSNTMESAALPKYPIIQEHKDTLQTAGCEGVLMSGSGPTVFGLCKDEAHARQIQADVGDIKTSVVHTVNQCVELHQD